MNKRAKTKTPTHSPHGEVIGPAGETLARRIQRLREQMGWTSAKLAEKAMLSETFIQDLESGLEPFLAPAVRQKLARALRVRVTTIQEVEKPPLNPVSTQLDEEILTELVSAICKFPQKSFFCSQCGAKLVVRFFERRDLQDIPIHLCKAHCSKCLFQFEKELPYGM